MKKLIDSYNSLQRTPRRIFWVISSITGLLLLFSISLVPSLQRASNILDQVSAATPFVLTALGIISVISVLSGHYRTGSWVFYVSTLVSMLLIPFIQEGFAAPAAILVLVVTVLVPLQAFSGRSTTTTTFIGLSVAGTIIAVDTFWPGVRTGVNAQDLLNSQISTAGLAVILAISIVVLYQTFNLRTKLLILTLGASFISVVVVAGFTSTFFQISLNDRTNEALLQAASHTADSIDTYIGYNRDLVVSQTTLPILRRYLMAPESERLSLRPELRQTLREMQQRDSENIGSYALLDVNGIDVMDTYAQDIGVDKSNRDYFWIVLATGNPYISPVRFSPTSPDHGFYISAPVRNGDEIIGILRTRLRSNLLDQIISDSTGFAGEGSYAILLDEYNIILANAARSDYFGRMPGTLDATTVNLLKSEGRLLTGMTIESMTLRMNAFAEALRNASDDPFFESRDSAFGEAVQGAIVSLDNRPWKVAVIQPSDIARAPITEQNRTTTLISLIASFILGVSTLFISRSITVPVSHLTTTAEQISAGNLKARVAIDSQDELGTLAETLNSMSSQLEQTLTGLERTVSQRTADLEQRSQELEQRTTEMELITLRSERRASQLLAVATVASAIANIQNLDELLPKITEVITRQFDFYHAGIFLNDAAGQFAVLRAANSEGGQRMLARGHKLKIGEVGIVGAVAASGRPRIALDTGEDAIYFNNPDLPQTRSEMALPLRFGSAIIGVLDVQSTESNAFTDEDIEILTILADQVSTAIRNTQLFEESQQAEAETQMLLQQYAREQWRRVARAQKGSGYRYDGAAVMPLEKRVDGDGIIRIPITVRGQIIGKLGIRAPQGRELNADELDIIRSVTERLAISAENARLLQESQERATKEQTIGEISSKIGASINLRSIMQTAVEELGKVLPGSEVTIKLDTKK